MKRRGSDSGIMNYGLRIADLASEIKKFILDTLFPVECLGCKGEGEWLCGDCFGKIKVDFHSRGGKSLDRVLTFYSYEDELLKTAIHALKYKFVEGLADPLGRLFLLGFKRANLRPAADTIVVPVPLHQKRLLERGFNQAELLATRIAEGLGCQFDNVTLRKTRRTVPQVSLDEMGRGENVCGAFAVFDSSKILNKKIILVDDVLTTGATMNECARALKRNGAKEVWGAALAKG